MHWWDLSLCIFWYSNAFYSARLNDFVFVFVPQGIWYSRIECRAISGPVYELVLGYNWLIELNISCNIFFGWNIHVFSISPVVPWSINQMENFMHKSFCSLCVRCGCDMFHSWRLQSGTGTSTFNIRSKGDDIGFPHRGTVQAEEDIDIHWDLLQLFDFDNNVLKT